MKNTSPELDAYIENAAPFARPILVAIRKAVHKADPRITEALKWGHPAFEYKGIVIGMAAFKQHVNWGFWKYQLMSDPEGILGDPRLKTTDVKELPPEKVLIAYVKEAVRLNEDGAKVERAPAKPKGEIEIPPALAAALKKNATARKAFEGFSPSHRREYAEWIAEAKQEATREKRVQQAIEWLSEGKPRNWKYMRK